MEEVVKYKNKCAICGKQFTTNIKIKKYCSSECKRKKIRQAVYEQNKSNVNIELKSSNKTVKNKKTNKCFICKKPLVGMQIKYCSTSCREMAAAMRAKIKKEKAQRQEFLSKSICPWELGEVFGTASNADPVLGF